MNYKLNFPFHLVQNSPWPLTISFSGLYLLVSIILLLQNKIGGELLLKLSIIAIAISSYKWINEIIQEGSFKGDHTNKVVVNLLLGFILFVISEVCIFISLFISFFYFSIIPSIEIGSQFPPLGIETLKPDYLPLLNTLLLFTSGLSITISQNYLYYNKLYYSIIYLVITILLGLLFSYFQWIEYYSSSFNITDSIFSTNFFILTGFHGIHVQIGTILIIISLIRLIKNHFISNNQIGLTASAIYWHMIDNVWLILFAVIYIWGY